MPESQRKLLPCVCQNPVLGQSGCSSTRQWSRAIRRHSPQHHPTWLPMKRCGRVSHQSQSTEKTKSKVLNAARWKEIVRKISKMSKWSPVPIPANASCVGKFLAPQEKKQRIPITASLNFASHSQECITPKAKGTLSSGARFYAQRTAIVKSLALLWTQWGRFMTLVRACDITCKGSIVSSAFNLLMPLQG